MGDSQLQSLFARISPFALLVACSVADPPRASTADAESGGTGTGGGELSTGSPSGGDTTADAETGDGGGTTGTSPDLGDGDAAGETEGDAARVRYGLAVDPDASPAELDAVFAHYEEIGVNHIWTSAAMEWLCGQGPSCDLAPLDAVVDRAEARGWTVALQVHGTPEWLDARGIWFGPDTAERRTAWVDLFAQLVARYGTRVGWYEVWNEPNIVEFWAQGPSPEQYAQLMHDVYVAAKASDPDVVIVGGNFSQNDLGFLENMYVALDDIYGTPDATANHYFFDVLGVHPYAGDESQGFAPGDDTHPDVETMFGPKDSDFLGYVRMHDAVLEHEGTAKDLVFGELGYNTTGGWFDVAESDRAIYVVDALRLARDHGYVRYVAWFTHDGTWFGIHDTATEAGFTAAATEP